MDDSYERILTTVPTVFVFKVPPRNATYGYRAKEFANDSNQVWVGKLQVISKGKLGMVKLINSKDGKIFAVCPVKGAIEQSVEKVSDSSRYFILRIENNEGKHAFIGIGFDTRDEAFDFNVALQDHLKNTDSETESSVGTKSAAGADLNLDFSLKQGQKIRINSDMVKKNKKKSKKSKKTEGDLDGGDFSLSYPHDEASKSKKHKKTKKKKKEKKEAETPNGGATGDLLGLESLTTSLNTDVIAAPASSTWVEF